ncbi:MAG: DUF3054 domain-containing protein [Microbacterium sp.]
MSTHPRPSIGRTVVPPFLVDVVLIVVFAVSGRASHGEDPLLGLWTTAWPFLAALVAGWAVARAWREPISPWRSGIPVWIVTIAAGLLLRVVSGQGAAWPFVVVASIVLLAMLVGWRLIATWREYRVAARLTGSESR